LRCRQREPSHGSTLYRTLRHPPRHERDRAAEHDGHAADATYPYQPCGANVDSNSDVGRATDVVPGADVTGDLTPNLTPNLG
jgi:hypothetical protein